MCAAQHACVMNIIVAILGYKLVAFKLLALTRYTSTATRYHMVPLECTLSLSALPLLQPFGYNNITYSMVVGMVSLISGAESGSSQSSTSGMMSPKGS
jgi:hypothetical protein